MSIGNGKFSIGRPLAVLAAFSFGAAALFNVGSRPARADVPASQLQLSYTTASVSDGVDWSRVPFAPMSAGATVGAYD
jgi:hypothetical protein